MLFKKLTLTVLLVVSLGLSKAQLNDNFNDGDFTSAPAWTGNTAVYMVNAGLQLQLNNTVAATTYLSTPFAAPSIDGFEWNIYVSQTFAPSGSNFGRIYLVSDQADITGSLNGYYLQLGEAGSLDAIELFRQTGSASTSVCRATNGAIAASFAVRIRVLRDATGLWKIYADYTGGTSYVLEASGTDNTYTSSAHFGLLATYTVSNVNKFFYDDIYMGPEIIDVTPPLLVSATPPSATTLDVLFNEPLDPLSSQVTGNYTVNGGIGNPNTVVLDGSNPKLVHLAFSTPFTNLSSYQLLVDNVADVNLNAIDNDTLNFFYFQSDTAVYHDVVINEFLADPTPQVGLPASEFVELYNRSTKTFDLGGWTIADGSTTATLPSKILLPGQYIILCSNSDTSDYKILGTTIGVGSLPSLNNSGDAITIKNNLGTTIDHIDYTLDWYHNTAKDDGGWTIEKINPHATCSNAINWSSSNDVAGGTPGSVNSIYDPTPDTSPPHIVSHNLTSGTQVVLQMSEAVDTSSSSGFSFTVSGGIAVTSFNVVGTGLNQIEVNFATPIDTGVVYTLTTTGVSDCEGNGTGVSNSIDFILSFQGQPGDIIINEVLFDPVSGADDFVEVYNNSSKLLNLKNWKLANLANDTVANQKTISTTDLVLNPGEYYAFTTDKAALMNQYPLAAFNRVLQIPSMPSYNNDAGTVILITNQNKVSDSFSYTDDMHFALLETVDGVSLERLDFNRATQDPGNWHSAAQSVGFATPGYTNSQYNPDGPADGELTLGGDIFSPDNDGYQDVMIFQYAFMEAGYVGNATLYDARGREVRKLMRSELLGTSGTFTWDGITDQNAKAPIGIYVIYFEYFNLSGTVKKIKKSFVLAGKF